MYNKTNARNEGIHSIASLMPHTFCWNWHLILLGINVIWRRRSAQGACNFHPCGRADFHFCLVLGHWPTFRTSYPNYYAGRGQLVGDLGVTRPECCWIYPSRSWRSSWRLKLFCQGRYIFSSINDSHMCNAKGVCLLVYIALWKLRLCAGKSRFKPG